MNKNKIRKLNYILIIVFLISLSSIIIVSCSDSVLMEAYNKANPQQIIENVEDVSNLTVVQQPNTLNISFSWTNPTKSDYSETIILKKDSSFPSSYNDVNATIIYSGNSTSYIDADLTPDTIYYYKIFTRNNKGRYSKGINTSVELIAINNIYNVEVSSFSLTQLPGTTNIQLSWSNPTSDDFIGVSILRKTGGYPTGINDPAASLVYYGTSETTTDTGLLANNVYYYTIFCRSDDGKVSLGIRNSIAVVNFPVSPNVYYEKVSNFYSTLGDGEVSLKWDNPSDPSFDSVIIKRKIGGYPSAYNDGSSVTIYEGTSDSFLDNTVVNGQTYYYAIFVKNKLGYYSNTSAKSYKNVLAFNPTIRNRCFYLIGGSSSYTEPFDNLISEIDAFDPVTETIYPNVTQLPVPRYSCSVASANGKIYVFGGVDSNKNLVSRVDILDISNPNWPDNIWTRAQDMPLPRYAFRAESTNGKIYIMGGSTGYSDINMGPTYLNYSRLYMTAKIHTYDPYTDIWITDEILSPNMQSVAGVKRMNFVSGSFGGNLFYAGGRYNGANTLTNTTFLQNMPSNYYITLGTLSSAVGESAGILFNKKRADNSELYVLFSLGGTNTNNTEYEPIRVMTSGANLVALNTCFFMRFENPGTANASPWTAVGGGTPRNLLTARAYAKAQYYGNYLYVFCGINNVGTVINSIEKINVDDDCTFPSGWQSVTSTGLVSRYAFDITKVNF